MLRKVDGNKFLILERKILRKIFGQVKIGVNSFFRMEKKYKAQADVSKYNHNGYDKKAKTPNGQGMPGGAIMN